jgi:hypothetical protein
MKIKYKKDGIELEDGTFISLETITEKCNNLKIKESNLVILELGWDGRGGSVFEQIALPKEKALQVKDFLLGQEVYFGEIWGKHSEVYGTICEKTMEIVEDTKKVKQFLKEFPDGWNYNHSFINTFIERNDELLEYEEATDVTREDLDFLESLVYNR